MCQSWESQETGLYRNAGQYVEVVRRPEEAG